MKSSEKFFNVAAPLFAIAIFAMAVILGIVTGNTVNWWAASGVFLGGLVLTVLFAMGMHVWNERMYGETIDRVKTFLSSLSMLGVVIMAIGAFRFVISPTDFAVYCLGIGAALFVAPVALAALCGFIRFISNRIEIYRMC